MPPARKATRHLAYRLVAVWAGTTLLAVLAAGCAGSAAPHALASLAQRQAISRFYTGKLWLADGSQSAGCPVDVLGAEVIGGRLRVYAVVHCTSFTAQCAAMTDYTEGLVADMAGTRVVRVFRDDAVDEAGAVTEAGIYPDSLRPLALNYMSYGGPRSLWDPAAKAAGCTHWTAPWRDGPYAGA
jgi:hypothetical protein